MGGVASAEQTEMRNGQLRGDQAVVISLESAPQLGKS